MYLKSFGLKIFLVFAFALLSIVSFAQEDEEYWKKLLNEEVEVENPVYKPVISIGTGVLSFFGDVKNPGTNMLAGKNGFKLNISTLVGKNNFYKLNFFALYGNISGQDYDISRKMQTMPVLPVDDNGDNIYPNSAFNTELYQFGINFEYGFGHLFKDQRKFKPFISIGVAPIMYSPKGDLTYGNTVPPSYYHFWSDGTIRDFAEGSPEAATAKVIHLNHKYETDLSKADLFGRGKYSQNSISIPVEVGFDFYLSYRINLRIASSINYTFTDLIDNYDSKVAKAIGLKGKGYNDYFTFTYFSMNFDLFSDPKSIMIEKAFAELENFDYEVLLADQDNDGIMDMVDKCLDTPAGVEVDTTGCPFDTDNDGVYNYLDKEENTPQGATVDDQGVQLNEDKLSEMFEQKNAVLRKEIRVVPVAPIWTRNITYTPGVIPDKFKAVDADGDGYISFTELLKTIDDYFDEKTTLNSDDIYELNNFFFSQ